MPVARRGSLRDLKKAVPLPIGLGVRFRAKRA